jgi:hypothetical protein
VAFSPRANYTDWATATCRRNLVPTFVDKGVPRGQRGGSPTVVNLSFLDRSWVTGMSFISVLYKSQICGQLRQVCLFLFANSSTDSFKYRNKERKQEGGLEGRRDLNPNRNFDKVYAAFHVRIISTSIPLILAWADIMKSRTAETLASWRQEAKCWRHSSSRSRLPSCYETDNLVRVYRGTSVTRCSNIHGDRRLDRQCLPGTWPAGGTRVVIRDLGKGHGIGLITSRAGISVGDPLLAASSTWHLYKL